MNDDEFREFLRKQEEARKQHEEFLKQLIPAKLKIMIEGFTSDADNYLIAREVEIKRATFAEREERFYYFQ